MRQSFDDVYNDAVDYGVEGEVPVGTPVGVAKLAHALRVFNNIMSGGLGFAVEVVGPDDFERAVEGFRYLGLSEVAELLAELVASYGNPDYDEQAEARLEAMMNAGDLVLDAFRRKVAVAPSDFGV